VIRGRLQLGDSGAADEAIGQLRVVVLDDLVRVLGADHSDTLATRNNIASWLGEGERVASRQPAASASSDCTWTQRRLKQQ
jgi:hypothetical protein